MLADVAQGNDVENQDVGASAIRTVLAITALALLPLAVRAAPAAPVALVTDVTGDVSLESPQAPVKLMEALPAEAEIVVGAGAHAVVFYLADGAQFTLAGPGRYRLHARAPAPARGAAPVERKAAPVAYRGLRLRTERTAQGGVVMRGADTWLRHPVKETVLDGDVEFRWDAPAGDATYEFELADEDGHVLHTARTQATTLRLPKGTTLRPGKGYVWAVRARPASGGGGEYRAAPFRVIDAGARRKLEAAQPAHDAPFSDRVLYAALLDDVGAHAAAQDLRDALARERGADWAR